MNQLEKYLKVKNQHLREIEEEISKVKEVAKREPSLRICVKRVGLTVSIDTIKVTFNLIFFYFSNIHFIYFRTSFPPSGEY